MSVDKFFEVIFQKNVFLNLLVIKCVKVGVKCFVSEGIIPASSYVEKRATLSFKSKVLVKCKNVVTVAVWFVFKKVDEMSFKVRSFEFITLLDPIKVFIIVNLGFYFVL